jgi:hypothetical protein
MIFWLDNYFNLTSMQVLNIHFLYSKQYFIFGYIRNLILIVFIFLLLIMYLFHFVIRKMLRKYHLGHFYCCYYFC